MYNFLKPYFLYNIRINYFNRILFNVIFSFVLCSFFYVLADPLQENERLQFADGLYAREMYKPALKEYEAFLKDFPQSRKADVVHFRIGESFRSLGNYIKAEKEFKFVFAKYQNSKFRHKAGFKRAALFIETKQYNVAIDLFKLLLKENPENNITSASLYFMGNAFIEKGETEEAVKVFSKIKDKYPESEFYFYALLKLGSIYGDDKKAESEDEFKKRAKKAIEFYNMAEDKLASDRVSAEALFQKAELCFRIKDFIQSAETYEKLITKYPEDQRVNGARLQAGWAAYNAGIYTKALKRTSEALAENKEITNNYIREEWLYLKANAERQLMNSSNAVNTYSQLLEQYPDSTFTEAVFYERALTYYKMGKYKKVVTDSEKIKNSKDLKKDVFWLMAESYSALKDTDNAIQYYRLIVKNFPESDIACNATYRLAHHLQKKKEYKEASKYYNIVTDKFPENELAPKSLFASAFCLTKEKMHAEAVRDLSVLIRKYPDKPLIEKAFYQKAMGEIQLSREDDAIDTFRNLLKRFPNSEFTADAHYWQGLLLEKSGKIQDAEMEIRLCLKSDTVKELERNATFHLAIILRNLNKFDEAAELFQTLLSSPLNNEIQPEVLKWLAEYRFGKGEFKKSIKVARLIVEKYTDPSWIQTGWGLMGRGYLSLSDTTSAENAFKKALEQKVSTSFMAESALRLGEIKLDTGVYKEAKKYFQQAASLLLSDDLAGIRAHAYAGLGKTAKAISDNETAVRYFMSVAILYNDSELVPECLYEAAEAFRKLNKEDDREKVLKELKERYPESDFTKNSSKK